MSVSQTRMSSRGQIVIPQDIRERVHANEGDVFAVTTDAGLIILKKVELPSRESILQRLRTRAAENQRIVQRKGIKESDVPEILHKSRRRTHKE